jgi:Double sensory domain of two-component sensor kinase
MKWTLIRTKVLAALVGCLVVGVGGILALMHYSFTRNSQALAVESVSSAQKLFTILEAREISKMTAVGDTLAVNREVRDAFSARDRSRLIELTAPLYTKLRSEGITNWMFHTAEPDMAVFLRLHNVVKFGDRLNRPMDQEVIRTHAVVAGNQMAKAGFAVRTLQPFYGSSGELSGYVEFGEEIGHFIHEMKSQTGDDYGLLLSKKFVDRQSWTESNALWNRRDNWNDSPNFVLADKTTANDSIIQFQEEVATLPGPGKVLECFRDGDSVFVRGIFPIHDIAGNTVGAMFVVRDISSFYHAMRHTQQVLVLVTVVALALGIFLVLTLLNRLIFRRLEHIIMVATRVVGGDYESGIQVDSDDEVGQFEKLFEQFRCVFVDLLAYVPELQGR